MDVYLDMVDASNGRGGINLGQYLNDDIIKRIMEDDLSIFITDAWLQPKGLQNGATYQGFPKFLVKAMEWGIPLEKVVRKMTGATADRFRLTDRGYLMPGFKADVTVFTPDRLAIFPDEPARKAEGIHSLTHSQRSYELLVVMEGVVMAERKGEPFRLHAGQAIWIMPFRIDRRICGASQWNFFENGMIFGLKENRTDRKKRNRHRIEKRVPPIDNKEVCL